MNYYKLLRLYYGMTVKEAAKVTGLSTGTISTAENGKRYVSPEVRGAYARNLPETEGFHAFCEQYAGMPDNKVE